MAIRFERDGAVGNIVLANPPFNRIDLCFAKECERKRHMFAGVRRVRDRPALRGQFGEWCAPNEYKDSNRI